MEDVGKNSGEGGGDQSGEPDEVVVFDDKIGEDGVEAVVENCQSDANEEIASGVLAGCIHIRIISYRAICFVLS